MSATSSNYIAHYALFSVVTSKRPIQNQFAMSGKGPRAYTQLLELI